MSRDPRVAGDEAAVALLLPPLAAELSPLCSGRIATTPEMPEADFSTWGTHEEKKMTLVASWHVLICRLVVQCSCKYSLGKAKPSGVHER